MRLWDMPGDARASARIVDAGGRRMGERDLRLTWSAHATRGSRSRARALEIETSRL